MEEKEVLQSQNNTEQENTFVTATQQNEVADVPPNTMPLGKKKKNSFSAPLTKLEGVLMFTIVLLLVVLFGFGISQSVSKTANDLDEHDHTLENRLFVLETQIDELSAQIASLETKIEAYTENKMPLNIVVNVDGVPQEISGTSEIENPSNPDISEQPTVEPEFDTSPFLGVGFVEGNDGSDNPIGIRIDHVYENSPAAFAGLKAGDILMSINGTKINTYEDLGKTIEQCSAQDIVTLEVAQSTDAGINIVTVEATLTYRGNFDLGEG